MGISVLLLLFSRPGNALVSRMISAAAEQYVLGDAELRIGRLDIGLRNGVHAYDVRILQDGIPTFSLDSVALHVRVLPLLQRTLHIPDLRLWGPSLSAWQRPDSSWNLATLLLPSDSAATWRIRLDSTSIVSARANVRPLGLPGDSEIAITMPLATASAIRAGRDLSQGRIHTLNLTAFYPNGPQRLDFSAVGAWTPESVTVDTLFLSSEESYLAGSGTLPLNIRQLDATDFYLQVRRLSFSDLRMLIPGLDSLGWVSGHAHALGNGDSLEGAFAIESADGMRARLDIRARDLANDRPRFDLDASISRFDPAYLSGNPDLKGDLNAVLTGSVTGLEWSRLAGDLSVEVAESRWMDGLISEARLDMALYDGSADIHVSAEAFDAEADIRLEGRFFDLNPTYRMAARLADIRFPFQPSEPPLVVLSGTFDAEGSGFELSSASLSAWASLDKLVIGTCAFPESSLKASFSDGRSSVTAQVGEPEMPDRPSLFAQADMGFAPGEVSISALTAEFVGLDPGCVSPQSDEGNLTGSFAVRGKWSTVRAHELTGNARLINSNWGIIPIDSLGVSAQSRNGLFDLQAAISAPPASATITARGSLAPSPWPFSITGRFDHLDASQLAPTAAPRTDLSASFETSGLVGSTGLTAARIDVQLEGSRWNRQDVTSGYLHARLDGADMLFTADVRTPGGGILAEGTGTTSNHHTRLDPLSVTFDRLDPAALLDLEGTESDLSGRIDGWFALSTEVPVSADLTLSLGPSRLNRSAISQATARLEAEGNEVRVRLNALSGTGRLSVTALATPWEEHPHVEVLARIQDIDLLGMATMEGPRSHVSGAAVFSSNLESAGKVSGGGMLSLGSSSVADLRLDTLLVDASYELGVLSVDTLWLVSNAGSVSGYGPVALSPEAVVPSNFRITATLDALANLRSLTGADVLEGKGVVSGRLSGTFERQRVELIPDLEYLIFNNVRIAGLQGRLAGEKPFTTGWEADLQSGFIANPYVSLQEANLEIEGGADLALWRLSVLIDGHRSIRVNGRLEMEAGIRRLVFDDVGLRLGPDRWSLLQSASLTLQNPYRIRNFLIASGSQQIAVDGEVDLKGAPNLVFTTEGLRAGAVADLFGYAGLEGSLNTFLVLSGTADHPEISGGFRLENIVSRGREVGSLNAEVTYANGRLDVDARLRSLLGQELVVTGYIPFLLSLTGLGEVPESLPADLSIQTAGFPIGWTGPFLDPSLITAIDGILTADIRVTGTQGAPELAGSAEVTRGTVLLPSTRVPYKEIEVRASLSGRSIFVEQAELHSGGGAMRASGTVEFLSLTHQAYDLHITAEDFRAIHTSTYRATVGGEFVLGGDSDAPTLTGDLKLGPADVFLTEELTAVELEPVRLTPRDLQILEARFGYRVSAADTTLFDFYQALGMTLSVEIERDVWLRSPKAPQMDVEFTGRIDVTKAAYADPSLYGTIQVNPRRSVVRQYGRRFEVQNGTLRFNGPFEETTVDFRAAYVVPARRGESGPTIYLDIKGHLEELHLEPSSEPSMETIDIVSYIATGRPAAEGLFGGGSGLDEQAAGLALGQLGMLIEGVAGEGLGLDVVEIENDGLRGATFTFGKYVSLETLRLYVSLKQPFNLSKAEASARTTRNAEASAELQLFRSMLFRVTSRSRSLRFNLLFEHAY